MNKTLIQKELKENFYASKGMWWLLTTAIFFSFLCFLILNIRELGSLAQTETIQYVVKIGIFLCALITMVLGSATFVAEREESTLESLMLAPISKTQISLSKLMGVLVMGGLIYLVSVPYIVALGLGTGLVFCSIMFVATVGVLLLVSYGCISIGLSILVPSSKASILISILFLIISAVPAFMSGLFNLSTFGQYINKISPIANTFKLMNALLIESQGIGTTLKFLMPIVGFTLVSIVFMMLSTKKIAFKGGE